MSAKKSVAKKLKPSGNYFGSHLLDIAIFSVCLGILIVFIVILKVLILQSRSLKTVEVKNVSPQVAAEVNKKLVYSSADSESKDYYSPSLDLLLKYNPQKYSFSEGVQDNIAFYPKSRLLFTERGEIALVKKAKIGEKINDYFLNKYKKLYSNTRVVGQAVEADFAWIKLSYSNTSLVDKNKTISQNHYLIAKKIDNFFLYIDFVYGNNFDIDGLKEDFKAILASVVLSPANIDTNLTLELRDAGVRFAVDKKKWNINGQNSLSLFLTSRDENYVILDVSAAERLNEAYWFESIGEDIKYIKENTRYKNLKFITQGEKEDIGGLSFIKYSFSYESWGENELQTRYYGFNPKTNYEVTIRIVVSNQENEGAKSLKSILDSFEFTDGGETSYRPDNENKVLGTASVQIDMSSLVGISSVVHIFNRSCAKIQVQSNIESLPFTSGKNYETCIAGFGSGFFVSKDGYLVTNAHVTKSSPKDIILTYLIYTEKLTGFWLDFLTDVNNYLVAKGETVDARTLVGYGSATFLELVNKGLINLTADYENFIEGMEPFKIDETTLELINTSQEAKAQTVEASDIESLFELSIQQALTGEIQSIRKPDLALLKIESSGVKEFPFLGLANINSIITGQSIQAIGFPGIAESKTFFSSAGPSIPTLTKGTISAIKPSVDGNFKLIQIDASISHGNSGGPIINQEADVVGVSTYGLGGGESADVNLGISADAVSSLLTKNGVNKESSKVVDLIKSGVDNLGKSYFKWAIQNFNEAALLYPLGTNALHPMIVLAQEKINNHEDKTPLLKIGSVGIGTSQIIIIGVGLLLIIGGVISIIFFLKKKKESQSITPPISSSPPMMPPTPPPIPPNPAGPIYSSPPINPISGSNPV